MISVLCVKFGNKYGDEYVEKLRNMVSRHLTVPYEFFCLTDSKHKIKGVTNIHLENQGYNRQWWHKVHMFDPSLGLNGRILYFDLDVIIHANIDKLTEANDVEFFGIRDFNRKFNPKWKYLNSSAMSWLAERNPDVFTTFKDNPKKAMTMHGDQDWIWRIAQSRITFWPDSWIQSYKWEIREKSELKYQGGRRFFTQTRNPIIPTECSICVFHGDPNPHDIQDQYVIDNWR